MQKVIYNGVLPGNIQEQTGGTVIVSPIFRVYFVLKKFSVLRIRIGSNASHGGKPMQIHGDLDPA
jgi:hypothetical protein